MDEEEKDLNKINDNYLFIFIDKAIHAASLQNSQITISISLHPSIYPLTSPPIFVKFNHVRFSFGLMLPFSEILNGEIHSISELKIKMEMNMKVLAYLQYLKIKSLSPCYQFMNQMMAILLHQGKQ